MESKHAWALVIVVFVLGGAWVFFGGTKTSTPQQVSESVLEIAENKMYDEISIPALAERDIIGKDLKLGQVLDNNSAYTRYYITYQSGDLTISGIMNVPKGEGPFPVLFLNHGYIDPAIYTNGRGLKREQDYLARRGYVVIHSDYRNHAESSKDPEADVNFRLGYAEDVIAGVEAVKVSGLPFFNKEKIGMLGHSMGGGVALQIMTAKPDLADAFVLFAGVSGRAEDNFNRWIVTRPETAERIISSKGTPESNPEFWNNISPINFLDKITAPVMIHHGTADADVPVEWSDELYEKLQAAGVESYYHVYLNQPHEFTTSWSEVMQKTVEFYDRILKN